MPNKLALDLQKYASEVKIVVGTDNPKQFKNCDNVISFKQKQTGILHCFNDKRFVIQECLLHADAAIYLDADTNIISQINQPLEISPGITVHIKNIVAHVNKYNPQNLENIKQIASKLNIPIEQVDWIGESLFIVAKDAVKLNDCVRLILLST